MRFFKKCKVRLSSLNYINIFIKININSGLIVEVKWNKYIVGIDVDI